MSPHHFDQMSQRSLVSRRRWKIQSITYGPTYGRTTMGSARDTCVSKKSAMEFFLPPFQLNDKSLPLHQVRGSVLFRQYYPEGGWGWVVVFVGALMIAFTQVNIRFHIYPTSSSQGIHLSFGVLVKPAVWRFR